MKVVMLDGGSLAGHSYETERRIFTENGIEFVEAGLTPGDKAGTIAAARDADGVITVYCDIDAEVVKELGKCRVLLRTGVGYDVIDVEAATRAGIAVCNVPDYCLQDVALHAVALILNALRKVTMYDRSVRQGQWNNGFGYPVHRAENLTLGFLGFGNIARRAAAYSAGFGFTMLGYDPYLPAERFDALKVRKVELDELLGQSDIVSVHAPLTGETRHILNRDAFAKMKDGVIVVNTSRGALIHQDDLADAIAGGKILAAGLDVVEREPLAGADRRILEHENVTVTPHASFSSVEANAELHLKIATSVVAVLKGELPHNVLNREAIAAAR